MKGLDHEIQKAIREADPKLDPRVLARQLTERFGKPVPVGVVIQVRGSLARAVNVNRAREAASERLSENLDIMEHAKSTLLGIFDDPSIPLKDRLEASKELRQWTKMQNDAAGIEDSETNTLFAIEGDWNMLPPER